MDRTRIKRPPLIIAGMHRSGTSLTASTLQKCGLHVGERLYPPDPGNILGHFENLDFINLHEDILEAQGLSSIGWVPQTTVSVPAQFIERCRQVVEQNACKSMWGWKDPRTTLFLNFWANFIFDSKFLFVFRPPWEVVDSLYRRGDKIFWNNANYALQMWLTYNRAILSFQKLHPERSLVISVDAIAYNPATVIDALNEKFALSLSVPGGDIFERSLLQRITGSTRRRALIEEFFPDAVKILSDLQSVSLPAEKPNGDGESTAEVLTSFKEWALQDWLDVRKSGAEASLARRHQETLSIELQEIRARAHESAQQAEQLTQHLVNANNEVQRLTQELCLAHDRLTAANADLEQLQPVREQLQTVREQLQTALEQLQTTQEQLEAAATAMRESCLQTQESKLQAEQLTQHLATARDEAQRLAQDLCLAQDRLMVANADIQQLQGAREELEVVRQESKAAAVETQESRSQALESKLQLELEAAAQRRDVERLKHELSVAQGRWAAADADRAQLEYELRIERDKLAAARSVDQRLRCQLKESYHAISAMENTRVWKLRDKYIRLKEGVPHLSLTRLRSWLSKRRWWAVN